jgi:hypothetical protein
MGVMAKDFENDDPNKLSGAIGFRKGAGSVGVGVEVCLELG